MARRTRSLATLGPATDAPGVLGGLVEAGVDVVRLNLAHGSMDEHRGRLGRVRAAAEAAGRHVGVLADLPGPKVRAAAFPEGGVLLTEGSVLRVVAEGAASDGDVVVVDSPGTVEGLEAGDAVVLGDGAVTLRVTVAGGGVATARVETGGRAQGRPGVASLPERLPGGAPTPEDLRLLDEVCEAGVDLVAVSFVRSAADVAKVRSAAGAGGPALVAKIETADALRDLDAIVAEADALMVARGDLGLRVPLEDVPWAQRRILRAGAAAAIPVITATQVLESMVHAPTPTRAEVSDVAGAVEDGTDALMLSGETAIGRDPVHVVRTMALLAARAEAEIDWADWGRRVGRLEGHGERPGALDPITVATTAAAWRAALDHDRGAIVCCTRSGRTAHALSRFRPALPVLAVTPSPRTARQLALTWGVESVVDEERSSTEAMTAAAVRHARRLGLAEPGSVVMVLAGSAADGPTTDLLRLVRG
ncbi:pyruvate kinase [soil metagenome]